MRINTKLTIGLLVLLFLAVWVTALFTLFFDTFEVRERHAGLIADSIINNRLVMPLLNYQYLSEKGDALVAGIAAVPFFLVLGPGYLSLKLTALFITVSTLVLWLAFARKYYGYLAMLFFGLFFIFSPPSFTKASLMSWGFHSQANLFIILSLLMFSYLNFDKKGNGPKYLYLFLGLACGFGLYSVKIFAVFLAALIIFWFFIEKNFFLKFKFYFFLAGFAVGYSPGALYNIRGGKYLVQVTDMPLWKFYFDNFLLRLKGVISTVFVDLPGSFMFSGPGNWANYLYFGLFLFCMAVMYFGAPDKKGDAKKALFRFMVFYLFLFAVALNFCPHTLEPKYA
ncbi:MAG: hypothetical protein FJZ15_03220, partial [Candidatus Omnitrophica bacterium]|nr:hypothetical protein [Candidatus Omnitrophota bacterium]